jgi:hypothetical protein
MVRSASSLAGAPFNREAAAHPFFTRPRSIHNQMNSAMRGTAIKSKITCCVLRVVLLEASSTVVKVIAEGHSFVLLAAADSSFMV